MAIEQSLPVSPGGALSPQQMTSRPLMPPNVNNVVLGNLHVKPWFPSFYPEDTLGGRKTEWLYVCQSCFKYTPEIMKYSAHCKVCPLKNGPPPGDLIYEQDGYAIYQIDGEEHKLYAQNLSLFAKLFLETKSVFFDASTFLYYTLVLPGLPENPHGQVVGFFSKEKMSWDNNNVACILVFPPWQKRGLGQILIAASYELGKREGRFGGPERPLSALGRRGYIVYWCGEVVRYILKAPLKRTATVKDISDETWILQEDVVAALKEMDVVEKRKTASGNIVVHQSKVKAWAEQHGVSEKSLIDVDAFVKGEESVEYEEDDNDE